MPWYRPLGSDELVWRDSDLLARPTTTSTPEDLAAILGVPDVDRMFDADHAEAEHRRVRGNIDAMASDLVKHDRTLAANPDRAREIATGAAMRVEHGSCKPTESRKRRK